MVKWGEEQILDITNKFITVVGFSVQFLLKIDHNLKLPIPVFPHFKFVLSPYRLGKYIFIYQLDK